MQISLRKEMWVTAVATTRLPLKDHGDFMMKLYENPIDTHEHFALIKEPLQKTPLVRIHSECITGDVFHSCKCDCGQQLDLSLAKIASEGGILIYLRQEGRGVGLANKLRAYTLQDKGLDTVEANEHLGLPADSRNYVIAYHILKELNIESVRLLTNNPFKVSALEQYGMTVLERIPVLVPPNAENAQYLKTKQAKLGHYLDIEEWGQV